MFHRLPIEPKDIFKVRNTGGSYDGLFTEGKIYEATYQKAQDDETGEIKVAKGFTVKADDGYWAWYGEDRFERIEE